MNLPTITRYNRDDENDFALVAVDSHLVWWDQTDGKVDDDIERCGCCDEQIDPDWFHCMNPMCEESQPEGRERRTASATGLSGYGLGTVKGIW